MKKNRQQPDSTSSTLTEIVEISRQFLRSVRIDSDLVREDALSGYICQGTARALLENMARQIQDTRHRAFTWTGPYGGGKSSLALMLCSLVGKDTALRKRAYEILDLPEDSIVHSTFRAQGEGWLVLPLVGKRAKISDELRNALLQTQGQSKKNHLSKGQIDVIGELIATAEQHPSGVLVVIDELGKFLESAAQEGDDIYFFQQLAEQASRSSGRLVVVGILHQAFEAYASRLGRQARDEWSKVQGRFIDIPLVAGTDEVVELVGRAIKVDNSFDKSGVDTFCMDIAHAIRKRRPGTQPTIAASLSRCWPLHPVVATLLGPISRRRFSQNERSTFGFLASREPLGFVEFLNGSPIDWTSLYGPSRYWDYLAANLETAILASPDGHRWAVASEAVERAEAKGKPIHIELTKCVALIELFRGGSGLVAEIEVLGVCVQGANSLQVKEALQDLISWKILIERKHLNAFGVFAGSDFDIDAAINQARSDIGVPSLQSLSALTDLQPVLAKRLYHETGTMRWFSRRIVRVDDIEHEAAHFKTEVGSVGAFLLCLPDQEVALSVAKERVQQLTAKYRDTGLVIGVPENSDRISELGLELSACEYVFNNRTEIDGDSVARKEVIGRISSIRSSLEDELSDAFGLTKWFWHGVQQNTEQNESISWIASNIAGVIFSDTPVLHNELVNRQSPSSNSIKARKDLMYRMVGHAYSKNLGYEGFPADAGLYFSILKQTGLHQEQSAGHWSFGDPFEHYPHQHLSQLWSKTKDGLLKERSTTTLANLYAVWAAPTIGLRAGIMPVLSLAFLLAHRSSLALYISGTFTSDLSEAVIDEWLLDPRRVRLDFVSGSDDQVAYLQAIAKSIPKEYSVKSDIAPLDVARALVAMAISLPNWTRRTSTISQEAQTWRSILLKASDPHKLLFSDIPAILQTKDTEDAFHKLSRVNEELLSSYHQILATVKTVLLRAIDHENNDLKQLRLRAEAVKGIAGEFRLEAFVVHLEGFDGTPLSIEGLISLASSKPPSQWVDRDIDAAMLQLSTWAHDFRRAETVAPLRGRPSNRRAIGIVFAGGMGQEANTSIDVAESDSAKISSLASSLLGALVGHRNDMALAALAEAGAILIKKVEKETN